MGVIRKLCGRGHTMVALANLWSSSKFCMVLPILEYARALKSAPVKTSQNRMTWKDPFFFLLKLNKWMVLTATNTGASGHHGSSSQSVFVTRSLTEFCKSLKDTFTWYFRVVNGNQNIKHDADSANPTPPPRNCAGHSGMPPPWLCQVVIFFLFGSDNKPSVLVIALASPS